MATPANVYIPNILRRHPTELEQASECVLKEREKERKKERKKERGRRKEGILNMNCFLEFTEVSFHSFLKEFCLRKPSGKYAAQVFLWVANTTVC